MTMLEIHAEALESSLPAYHEFLLAYKSTTRKIVFGFVEGKDDPSFYQYIIEHNLPSGWKVKLIPVGSKSKVIGLFETMNWERFPRKMVCFFVDRDLSKLLGESCETHDNFYVTDQYSIENDVVNFDVFDDCIRDFFSVNKVSEQEREKLEQNFHANVMFFCEEMIPVMAQIISWKRSGAETNLNNIKLEEIFSFQEGKAILKSVHSTPRSRINYAGEKCGLICSDDAEINAITVELKHDNFFKKYIRGKYLMWFFVKFADHIHKTIHLFCAAHTKPPKARVSCGVANIVVLLAPRVRRAPESLKHFLQQNYGEYIQLAEAS